MKQPVIVLSLLSFLLFFACRKSELEREVHENLIITGNTPPPYNGVSSILVQNYINRIYIDLVGREPDNAEMTAGVNSLVTNNYSQASRDAIVEGLLNTAGYHERLYDVISGKMLNGADSAEISGWIFLLTLLKAQTDSVGDSLSSYIYQGEISKLVNLMDARPDYASSSITINEYIARVINNLIYDDINMGSDNYVVATFENLFNRYPTDAERAAAVDMVDGASSQLFLVDGDSKTDFIAIVTGADDFYEGLVVENYLNLLLRNPTSFEMGSHADSLAAGTYDLQGLQKRIIKSMEYAGF